MEPFRSASDRALLEPCTDFDPAAAAGLSAAVPLTIRSLAVVKPSLTDSAKTLIFVGTGGGKILIFSLDPSDSTVEFLKSATVSNRLIDSIVVLHEISRLLVLSDGFLFLIDLFLLQPAKKVGFLKGVTAFSKRVPCSDDDGLSSSDLFDNDAAVKLPRKKLFQKLANGSGIRVSEGKREDGASCFVAAAAAGKGLVMMKLVSPIAEVQSDSEHGGISISWKEIQGIDGVKTMAWLGDSVILGTSDGYSIVSVTSGKCTPVFSLPEASGPPRLKCLCRSKEVMLLVDNVGVVANEAGQPVGGALIFQYAPVSVVEMGCYVIVVRDGRLDLYSRKSRVCIQTLSVARESAGQCIAASNDLGNGDVVAIATTYKVICYRRVSAEEQIKDSLRKKNFKEAISLVEEFESEGEISREMLSFVHAQVGFLLLFDLHFEDAVNHFLLSEAMQPSEIFPFIMRDPNRWSHLVPRNRYWGLHPPPAPLEQVVDDGLMAIQRSIFLRKAGVETAIDDAFLLNPPSRANLLQSAIENITRYLCVSRERDLIPQVKEGVDTLLMYLYRALNRVEDMEQLASSSNSCVVEELETLLNDSGHLRTLAFLYASQGMYSKALAIWRVLARNYSTGLWRDSSSVVYDSVYESRDLVSGEKSAAVEASKLLQESSDQDLVLEHLGWIADVDQELAIMVLTSEKRVNQLSPEQVLAAVDPNKVDIQQRYLQWLIEDQDSDETRFHTLYALSLAKSAIETVDVDCDNEISNCRRFDKINISDVETVGTCPYPVRERLQLFLQASDLYDPEEVLHVIEGSELWLEKAILYRKMGEETLVLQILALKLEDSEAAEQYCAEIGRSDAYMQLLDMYLDPQDGKEPMFKAAVRLLHNHGESLDPLQVLEKLSPDMPLQLASDTILRMLRARVHHHRQGQIVHNLSRAIDLDARSSRLEERSRHVQINDESTCDSCHARLGTKLFAMYPDDSVVCYKCFRRQGESTSSRGHNFKQNPIFKPGWLVSR